MELKYIILTIIKILISVPTIVMVTHTQAEASTMMDAHFDNSTNVTTSGNVNLTDAHEFKIDLSEGESEPLKINETNSQESSVTTLKSKILPQEDTSEEIPDPSALVVPGYNLPESIFNKGKPFFLERDPVTGNIDFNSKPPLPKMYDEYEYFEEEQPSGYDIHDKANINRKDSGNIGSHKPSDINQLTPNFHDFLNLPVKYNPDKYVYPLISSSYANTKVQGNVNKIHNHKDYSVTTYKPNYNHPTYHTTKHYFAPTTQKPTTPSSQPPIRHTTATIHLTTTNTEKNLMNSPMNHPSYGQQKYQNLPKVKPTTKKTMSLFEQLFGGDYEEETTTTVSTTEPTTMKHEIYNGNKITNGHMAPAQEQNILNGSNMVYEYEDDFTEYPTSVSDSVMVETKKRPLLIQVTTPQQEAETATKKTSNTYQVAEVDFRDGTDVTEYETRKDTTTAKSTTSIPNVEKVVTSLPIGDNHVTQKQPIIVATQNLREKLASERVEGAKPFSKVPNQSSIHIAPDQDTVSFVVGHHQSVDGSASGGQYHGTSLKESPYDSNPFRPVYGVQAVPPENTKYNTINLQTNNKEDVYYQKYPASVEEKEIFITGDDKPQVVTIQPIRSSEASLAIGDPISSVKVKPAGQVVDDQLEINRETIEFPRGTGPKIVFPDDKPTTYSPPHHITHQLLPNRDNQILQLSSKPMFHQLPSDLTPPREQFQSNKPATAGPPKVDRVRPPWDPRPGHFHQGRPEYARPPRPPPNTANNEIYKRVDTLPNILPQFRPNMNNNNRASPPHHGHHGHGHHHHHHHPQRIQNNNHGQGHKTNYVRQPLLERPSNNRPIGFFEKLHPPLPQQNVVVPPSPPKSLQNLRKVPALENEMKLRQQQHQQTGDRIMNNLNINQKPQEVVQLKGEPLYGFLSAPPTVVLSNRRNGLSDDPEVETLQMIQAKLTDRKENATNTIVKANMNGKDTLEKPLYVVYPVNTQSVQLDGVHDNKKESVVIGTRAELPLPPNKISSSDPSKEFNFEQNDRHDSPILKPHNRPSTYPIKSDFPYPLERPDPSVLNPPVPDNSNNNLDTPHEGKLPDEPNFMLSNQWNTIDMEESQQTEARIVSGGKINTNQISATLKTYTEKPIAVAYTPTEPTSLNIDLDKYSLPNYASLVIPEIRQGQANTNNEFTVSAVMHTHNQNADLATQNMAFIGQNQQSRRPNAPAVIIDQDTDPLDSNNRIAQQEFQAPFQASANLDAVNSPSQGWAVINRSKDSSSKDDSSDTTLLPLATTKEFDIENFKPQLEGGFKPIYSYPDETETNSKGNKMQVNERQEK